jgi:hypothetical protein
MNKYNFSKLQREVIFKGYDKKCFYCENVFSLMGDMQIDHFIERNLLEKEEELENLKKSLKVHPEFEIDSYYNFVPFHMGCHMRKHKNEFSIRRKAIFLEEIASKVPKLITLEEKLKRDKTKTRILNELKRKLELGVISIEEIKAIYWERIELENDFKERRREIHQEILKYLKPSFRNFARYPLFSRLELIIYLIFMIGSYYLLDFFNISILIWIPTISFFFLIIFSRKFIIWRKKMKAIYKEFKKLEI